MLGVESLSALQRGRQRLAELSLPGFSRERKLGEVERLGLDE